MSKTVACLTENRISCITLKDTEPPYTSEAAVSAFFFLPISVSGRMEDQLNQKSSPELWHHKLKNMFTSLTGIATC